MNEILENVFPELLEAEKVHEFTALFLQPLIDLVQRDPKGASSGSLQQATSVGFCLRKIVNFLVTQYPAMVTLDLCDKIVYCFIKAKHIESNMIELIRDLLKFR